MDKFEFEPTIQKDGLMTDALEKAISLFSKFQKKPSLRKVHALPASFPFQEDMLYWCLLPIPLEFQKIDKPEERERLIQVMQKSDQEILVCSAYQCRRCWSG